MPKARNDHPRALHELLTLSHELGREDRRLAILGEGNVSVRTRGGTFLVKASGARLASLSAGEIAACRADALLPLLDQTSLTDAAIDDALLDARENPKARKPSVEAIFHAYLLSIPGVAFVGHTHPVAVNQILCSTLARAFGTRRLFPDEVVCCGTESVFVPYLDPGLKLAQGIRSAVGAHLRRHSCPPRVILLENHGLIALGPNAESVLASTMMTVKAAEIFAGAAAMGGLPRFLTPGQVARIAGRADEHYRQRTLGMVT